MADDPEKKFKKVRTEIVRGRTALLKSTRDEIVRMLNEALARVKTTLAGQPTDYQNWQLPQLQREIEQALGEFGRGAAATLSTRAGDAWQLGIDLVEKPLEAGGVRIIGAAPLIDTRQLSAMRAFMTDRIKDVGLAAVNKINTQLGLVVIGAAAPSDAIGEVTAILGEPSRARATAIVRTNLGQAFSAASQARLEQVARVVPGMQKMWRRSGKLHPRFHHDLADGQIRDVDKPFLLKPFGKPPVEMMYPHDPRAPASEVINCGCTAVPHKADWKLTTPGRSPAPSGNDIEPGPSIGELLDRLPAPARRKVPA